MSIVGWVMFVIGVANALAGTVLAIRGARRAPPGEMQFLLYAAALGGLCMLGLATAVVISMWGGVF